MNKKILDKINKLIALGTSPERGESDTALSMVENLMREYGVSYTELNSTRIEEELGAIGKEMFAEEDMPQKAFHQWETILGSIVASHFDCVYLTKVLKKNLVGKRRCFYTPLFVGHEGNRRTALILWDFLRRRIAGEARKFSPSDVKGFGFGVVTELVKKYPPKKKEDGKTGGTELMVLSEVDRWIKENLETEKGRKVTISGTSEGYEAGKKFGKDLSLNRQFGQKYLSV